MKRSISVIIPAFNEEGAIEKTAREVMKVCRQFFKEFEIILVNDGSTDNTANQIRLLGKKFSEIKVIQNKINKGFGAAYQAGVRSATMDYIAIIPGDNEILQESIKIIFSHVGKADIIIPFSINMEIRSFSRTILSKSFTLVMNLLFNINIQYFNGPVIHKRTILQSIPFSTKGFAFQASILVKMLKRGYSFIEVPMYLSQRKSGRSSALKLKNILSVFFVVFNLWVDIVFINGKFKTPINRKFFIS